MLDVDGILPSPMTPLVLSPPVPEQVCKMQTPALFSISQAFAKTQSVDSATYARVNPLPSPATSSSSSGEVQLYIGGDPSSHTAPTAQLSSSLELLIEGQKPVPQPPQSFTMAPQPPPLVLQPPKQPPHSSSWLMRLLQNNWVTQNPKQ